MRYFWLLLCPLLLGACQEERKVVYDHSASAKFLAMLGGKPTAGGDAAGVWQITRNDQPKKGAKGPDPNVRVIRPADFSGYTFHTNFQIDDPAAKKTRSPTSQPASATEPASPLLPFGALPVLPDR